MNFTNNKQISPVISYQGGPTKFIEEIAVTPQVASENISIKTELKVSLVEKGLNIQGSPVLAQEAKEISTYFANRDAEVERASSVQLKYAILLNTEVESLPASELLESVDEWYGVRYRTGGNTKKGVDCSGFSVAVYAAVYGIALPRVSREQYRISRKISTTELQEGDLVFFNTRGNGVSHVGVYLGNNKFIHASVSRGVMVNGLFETYYLQRFVGAGRIDNKQVVSSN